jgi:superfamily II RNA helicase
MVMMMIVEQLVECELAGETEALGENLPQCHVVQHKYHMT